MVLRVENQERLLLGHFVSRREAQSHEWRGMAGVR